MKRIFFIILALVLLGGCAGIRQSVLDISNESLKAAEAKREVGKNILSSWPIDSGIIRAGLGSGFGKLPQEAVTGMDDLDLLAAKETKTDSDYGRAIGDVILIYRAVGIGIIRQYSPNWLAVIPAFLGF